MGAYVDSSVWYNMSLKESGHVLFYGGHLENDIYSQ